MTELSAQMMAARGAALQVDVDEALALKADQTALDAVSDVANAAVTPSELTAALAPYATNADAYVTIAGTSYTFSAANIGKVHEFTSATAVAAVVPTATAGVNFLWRQVGAGQITFSTTSGPLRSFGGATKSAGQYAEGALAVSAAGEWYLSGTIE